MENASKALIMAGIIIISIIVISLAVVLFKHATNFSKENDQRISNQQLREFNVQFGKFEFNSSATEEKYKNYIKAQDVRTIVNLAKDYNTKNDEAIIDVRYGGTNLLTQNDAWWISFLENANQNEKKYKCIITRSVYNGKQYNDIYRKITIMDGP